MISIDHRSMTFIRPHRSRILRT